MEYVQLAKDKMSQGDEKNAVSYLRRVRGASFSIAPDLLPLFA